MAELRKILKHLVMDVETKQIVAGFSSVEQAELFADRMETRTGREFLVHAS